MKALCPSVGECQGREPGEGGLVSRERRGKEGISKERKWFCPGGGVDSGGNRPGTGCVCVCVRAHGWETPHFPLIEYFFLLVTEALKKSP